MYEHYITHTGRKGMKWGQRIFSKYQEMRRRRSGRYSTSNLSNEAIDSAMRAHRQKSVLKDLYKNYNLSGDRRREVRALFKRFNKASPKEINDAIARLTKESQYNRMKYGDRDRVVKSAMGTTKRILIAKLKRRLAKKINDPIGKELASNAVENVFSSKSKEELISKAIDRIGEKHVTRVLKEVNHITRKRKNK